MPYITVECGALSNSQKEALIRELTRTASEITGTPPEFFLVTLKELPDQNIGIGGRTIDQVKAAYRQNNP